MEPFVPGTAPLDPDIMRRAMRLSIAPQQEKLERERMARAAALAGPHKRITSGALPAALWGAGDAAGDLFAGLAQREGNQRLESLYGQQLEDRRAMYDALNAPDPQKPVDPREGTPDMLRRPDDPAETQQREQGYQQNMDASALRRKNAAVAMSMTGDPAMEEAAKRMQAQQQLDREYAQMHQQLEHQKRQMTLEERKASEAERHARFQEGHEQRGETDWGEAKYEPSLGGYLQGSKRTGETWLFREGEKPKLVVAGRPMPGAPSSTPGAPPQSDMSGPHDPNAPLGVKMNTEQEQTYLRATNTLRGLQDAIAPGYPDNSFLKGSAEALRWKAAEGGYSQLATPDQQQRVAGWDAVVDPIIRAQGGVRIPEDQMKRKRLEWRPNPGESWDTHVWKVSRIIDFAKTEARSLPPPVAKEILKKVAEMEAALPNNKAEYDAHNLQAAQRMKQMREGGASTRSPVNAVVPPQVTQPAPPPAAGPGPAAAPAPQPPQQQIPLQQRKQQYLKR